LVRNSLGEVGGQHDANVFRHSERAQRDPE